MTHLAPARTGSRRLLAGLALALTTTAALAACSSSGDGGSAGGSSGLAAHDESAADAASRESGRTAGGRRSAVVAQELAQEERVVSTGSVALESDDVGRTRSEVQRVVDGYGGQVAQSEADTGDDGEPLRARMVLRVPVADFDEAMEEIEDLAELRSSDQRSDIVTEEYVDLQARVRAQERSLERVELLFTRAQSIRDIMAIESQLTSRQAELDSLKGQLQALDDRTTFSTITVHVERTPQAAPDDDDRAGFLAGLDSGWSALGAATVAVATVLGAVLPFAMVLALVGFPLWLVLRALLRRRPAPAGGEQPAE